MHTKRCICVAIFLLSGATGEVSAEFVPLGFLPGGQVQSGAYDVSADGAVVVGVSYFSAFPATPFGEAFRWTQAGGMTGLGYPPGPPSHWTAALAVSADGKVAAGQSFFPSFVNEAFRWTPTTGVVGLGDLGPTILNSGASGVSADGSVVVGGGRSAAGQEAFRWTQATGMVGLGDFPGGPFLSGASGVSADGSIVVGTGHGIRLEDEAFRWTAGTGLVGLGFLPGGDSSSANAVSPDGAVIVGSGRNAAGMTEAFRWAAGTGMRGLGFLSGARVSLASDVSADGSVVVGISGDEAFIWDAQNGIRNLLDVLLDQGDDLAGWTLVFARGVSADGTTIVGEGRNPRGEIEAFMARLGAPPLATPEPSSLMLLGLGALGLLGCGGLRSRRREQ